MNLISRLKYLLKDKVIILLLLITLLSSFLRIYKLDSVPPSLNWDEAAAGYNAYTIANWGADEWGNFLPLVFKSFGDDKHPVHIYTTAIFVKILGLSDFVVRLPSALLGIISIVVVFYLSLIFFKSKLTALLAALFLAVSPYHLQFSRGLWESNFALSFFLLGLLLFFLSFSKRKYFLILSYLCFGLSLFSYHSAKVVVPPVVILLTAVNIKQLMKLSFNFYIGIFIFLIFISLIVIDPRLSGAARADQNRFSKEVIQKTEIYKKTNNSVLGWVEAGLRQYSFHFTPDYLFILGDKTPRNSTKTFGQFYKIQALFLIAGLIFLIRINPKIVIVLLTWLLFSPLPSSLVVGAPNANRAIFMLGILNLISAFGAGSIINLFKRQWKIIPLAVFLIVLTIESTLFINYYFKEYPKKDSIDWVYGMKQITDYLNENPNYDQVYMTNLRSQPYIFFLYYLKIPLPEYLKNVYYNNTESKSYNTVTMFDKYIFDGWDPIESFPNKDILYIVGPSHYDGLRHKAEFDVKKAVYYPNGLEAFFLVTGKNK